MAGTGLAKTSALLSVPEVAEMTGKSTRTIRRWITEGKLKASRPGVSGQFLIDRHDLAECLKYNPVNAPDPEG